MTDEQTRALLDTSIFELRHDESKREVLAELVDACIFELDQVSDLIQQDLSGLTAANKKVRNVGQLVKKLGVILETALADEAARKP